MKLRKGKTRNILEGSINTALLAVEVYNKPRTTFRSQAYIVLMIIAWTRLFHAYFNKTIGDKYYYKSKNGRYEIIDKDDKERKAWDLNVCIDKFGSISESVSLSESVKANLKLFIKLRNKIEHRYVTEKEVDVLIFGECQSLLYNYENLLIEIFGEEYALNENLAFSLQFSSMRTDEQKQANKNVLSADALEIKSYIENYRSALVDDIYNAQEYSIKIIQIPKVSNTNRHDLAIEFVREDELDPDTLESITAIIKDKRVVVEAKNVDGILPGQVVTKVRERIDVDFVMHDHTCLRTIFSIRPREKDPEPNKTNVNYCVYDQTHKDYVYQDIWVDFIVKLYEKYGLTKEKIRQAHNVGEKWDINKYS